VQVAVQLIACDRLGVDRPADLQSPTHPPWVSRYAASMVRNTASAHPFFPKAAQQQCSCDAKDACVGKKQELHIAPHNNCILLTYLLTWLGYNPSTPPLNG
jgi:hypothetical protein